MNWLQIESRQCVIFIAILAFLSFSFLLCRSIVIIYVREVLYYSQNLGVAPINGSIETNWPLGHDNSALCIGAIQLLSCLMMHKMSLLISVCTIVSPFWKPSGTECFISACHNDWMSTQRPTNTTCGHRFIIRANNLNIPFIGRVVYHVSQPKVSPTQTKLEDKQLIHYFLHLTCHTLSSTCV